MSCPTKKQALTGQSCCGPYARSACRVVVPAAGVGVRRPVVHGPAWVLRAGATTLMESLWCAACPPTSPWVNRSVLPPDLLVLSVASAASAITLCG